MENKSVNILFSIVLLVIVVIFGWNDKVTQMGLLVLVGFFCLAFINIKHVHKFKAGGVEAEMRQAVYEANATIIQLKELAKGVAGTTLTTMMAGSFFDGMTLAQKLDLYDEFIEYLKKIGLTEDEISKASVNWSKGIKVIYFRGISNEISKKQNQNSINEKKLDAIKIFAKEFHELLNFKNWEIPSCDFLRKKIVDHGFMDPKIDSLLIDLKTYEDTNKIQRRDIFINL